MEEWWNEHWPGWYAKLAAVDPLYYAVGVGLLLLLFVIRAMVRQRKKRAINPAMLPQLTLQSFQIAPLGRDAFLKIRNDGPVAQLSAVNIIGRTDIILKNSAAGQVIATGKEYSLLLEAASTNRLTNNLTIELIFSGPDGKAYRQTFSSHSPVPSPARRY